ncbi:hypothetical protein [Xanthobacter sp. 91]|uniref:hypothetical protein n=1 Tax=Xanthobacter sp. 91 TaxID=1117244 RepID=UPI000496012C|nr:hypothetical protein [Xanthobacter sp. 91]
MQKIDRWNAVTLLAAGTTLGAILGASLTIEWQPDGFGGHSWYDIFKDLGGFFGAIFTFAAVVVAFLAIRRDDMRAKSGEKAVQYVINSRLKDHLNLIAVAWEAADQAILAPHNDAKAALRSKLAFDLLEKTGRSISREHLTRVMDMRSQIDPVQADLLNEIYETIKELDADVISVKTERIQYAPQLRLEMIRVYLSYLADRVAIYDARLAEIFSSCTKQELNLRSDADLTRDSFNQKVREIDALGTD